jgi:hypothetical protein
METTRPEKFLLESLDAWEQSSRESQISKKTSFTTNDKLVLKSEQMPVEALYLLFFRHGLQIGLDFILLGFSELEQQ